MRRCCRLSNNRLTGSFEGDSQHIGSCWVQWGRTVDTVRLSSLSVFMWEELMHEYVYPLCGEDETTHDDVDPEKIID